jgi:hypothetical protein
MKTVVVLGIVVAVEVLEVVAVMVVVITKPLRSNLELFKAMSEGVLFGLPMKL